MTGHGRGEMITNLALGQLKFQFSLIKRELKLRKDLSLFHQPEGLGRGMDRGSLLRQPRLHQRLTDFEFR